MDLLPTLRRLFAHDNWANRETLLSIQRATDIPRARRLLAHIVATQWVWLSRLQQDGKKVIVWPELTLADCETQIGQLRSAWHDYFERLAPDGHAATVAYVNSKGQRWTSTVADILLHVPLHSSYHRGQIALVLRDAGAAPAYTDYIEGVRTGALRE